LPLAGCNVKGVIGTARAFFSASLPPTAWILFVRVPCTTRTDVIRTARCYFAPCRAQCKGYYRHGTGPFSACLAPTAWILFVRVPRTTRTDVIRTARCYFAPCRVQCKGCYRHGPIFCLPCANRMSFIRKGAVYNADGRYPHGRVLF